MIDQIFNYNKTFVEQNGLREVSDRQVPRRRSKMASIIYPFVFVALLLCSCHHGKTNKITAEMAYEGVNNYCYKEYDWSVAEDNPDMMYIQMGEETDSTYQVVFRSYTGAFVHFYVNKASGTTRMVERVPNLDVEQDAGTIDLFDYLVIKQ